MIDNNSTPKSMDSSILKDHLDMMVTFDGRRMRHAVAVLMAATRCEKGPVEGAAIIYTMRAHGVTITQEEFDSMGVTDELLRSVLEECIENQ